jgi:hypothetical protein
MATASTVDNTPTFNPFMVGQSRATAQKTLIGVTIAVTVLCALMLIAYGWVAVLRRDIYPYDGHRGGRTRW